jgi:hypothetical protein
MRLDKRCDEREDKGMTPIAIDNTLESTNRTTLLLQYCNDLMTRVSGLMQFFNGSMEFSKSADLIGGVLEKGFLFVICGRR